VLLAAPPGWETRFLAGVLHEVARVPLRVFVRLGAAGGEWRDARSLNRVSAQEVTSAVRRAQLVVRAGNASSALPRAAGTAATLVVAGPPPESVGDWYLRASDASPLAGRLAGIDWDALPPATALAPAAPPLPPHQMVGLSAMLARRGAPQPAVVLADSGGYRRATILAAGLWRWQFRGEEGAVAYRTLVASLVDWLLDTGGGGTGARDRAVPEARVVANGLPVRWRWTDPDVSGPPAGLEIRLDGPGGTRSDTLRFDAGGRAELRLPPGVYRYRLGGGQPGVVAVETYSDEWRPRPVALREQPGTGGGRLRSVDMRARGWLFVVLIAALVAEWVWRRRQGLP
jgi:hypothetical protein